MEKTQTIQTIGIYLVLFGVVALLLQGANLVDNNISGDASKASIAAEKHGLPENIENIYLSSLEKEFIEEVEINPQTKFMAVSQKKELFDVQRQIVKAVEECPQIQAVARMAEARENGASDPKLQEQARNAIINCEFLDPNIRELAKTNMESERGNLQGMAGEKGVMDWVSGLMNAGMCASGNVGSCISLAYNVITRLSA